MFCTNCGSQQEDGSRFCTNCGQELIFSPKKGLKKTKIIVYIVIGVILGLLLLFLLFTNYEDSESETNYVKQPANNESISSTNNDNFNFNQSEITASVVNIYCENIESEEDSGGGSGTIISNDGVILTNSHIIPQDEEYILTGEEGCMVTLPDPDTGQPLELYLAEPISIPGLSDIYDIAFLQIYDAYYDEEEQEYWGTYPREFPFFNDEGRCFDENVRLGEPVRIFGYPTLSGGYNLTVTDGVVSSIDSDYGLIYTSAKIGYGNSGGLAVDRNGCMIGIPSMISSDEAESLGVIISTDLIYEFLEELETYLGE